jgi:hypothetical protein
MNSETEKYGKSLSCTKFQNSIMGMEKWEVLIKQ